MAYEINYEDPKFQQVEADKNAAIGEMENTYSDMINESDSYYQAQIDASKEWEQQQIKNQQEQTDFAIQKIEQQKDQTKKDYVKEQSGSYVDWQKQSNQYGANAEAMAAQGMQNTGYSESSQVSMYNTYQNRVATARETYNRAVQDFNNSITEARLQNNSILAQIAYEANKQRLELSLQGFQYKNQLILDQANKKTELEQLYHARWQDVLNQMNTENALAEQIRQFDEQMAEEKRQFDQLHKKSSKSSRRSSGGGREQLEGGNGTGDLASDTADSILNLGAGPISAETLADMVESGEVNQGSSTTTHNPVFIDNTGNNNANNGAPWLPYTWPYL